MKRPKYSKDNIVEFKNGREDSPARCIGLIVAIREEENDYCYQVECASSRYLVHETSIITRFIDIESGNH